MDFDDLDEVEGVDEEEEVEDAEPEVEYKEITLWIPATGASLKVPIKTTDTILKSKQQIAEMFGVDVPTIRLGQALGGYVEYYPDDSLTCAVKDPNQVAIKGIYDFANMRCHYPHPFLCIGGGHNGCRQAVEYKRRGLDHLLLERKDKFGGNAWASIANDQSRLQSEGMSYQIGYDPFDGRHNKIWRNKEYTGDEWNHWPSRKRILENYHAIVTEHEVTYMLNTEAVKMDIVPESEGGDFREKYYDMHWENKVEGTSGVYRCSCITVYPGAMCHTRRHEWPGEKEFGGIIGYGVSNEFPYDQIEGKVGIIIGMGAFFAENVRTCCESKCKKVIGVCRHFNLMCPRVCSWTMSINYQPAMAAEILNMMVPMYKLAGLDDPWDWWSVQNKNETKTFATIKQYTRWGVGDIYFLAHYYGRCEMMPSEVKTFIPGGAKLSIGKTIEIQYVVKVLGFLSDFGVDKLMQCNKMLGPFPEGDWRRWILSDQSEIDANRFGSLGLACGAASFVRQSIWYHEHPMDALRLLDAGVLMENYAEPELGLTAYHYHPRKGTANMMMVGKYCGTLDSFHMENDCFRIELYRQNASPALWLEACTKDWNKYCNLFKECGDTIAPPPYPYTLAMLEGVIERQEETESYFLAYKCHKTYGKESLGFVAEVETALR